MRESLSIRAYQPTLRKHSHHFHQIVVPLRGSIDISLNNFESSIAVGPLHGLTLCEAAEDARRRPVVLIENPIDLDLGEPAGRIEDDGFG